MYGLRPICRKALNCYGSSHHLLQSLRVGSRLLAALSDFYEGRTGSHKKLVAELANMQVTLEILTLIAGPLVVGQCLTEKVKNLKKGMNICDGKEVSVLIRTTKGEVYGVDIEQQVFSPEDAVREAYREYDADYNFYDLEMDSVTVRCKEDNVSMEYNRESVQDIIDQPPRV